MDIFKKKKNIYSFNWNRPRLRCKFNTISLIVLVFGLAEQIIWIVNMISSQPATDYFISTWQECFRILHSKSDLFSLNKCKKLFHKICFKNINGNFFLLTVNYSLWGNFILFIVSNYAVLIWNFSDLFIMLVNKLYYMVNFYHKK